MRRNRRVAIVCRTTKTARQECIVVCTFPQRCERNVAVECHRQRISVFGRTCCIHSLSLMSSSGGELFSSSTVAAMMDVVNIRNCKFHSNSPAPKIAVLASVIAAKAKWKIRIGAAFSPTERRSMHSLLSSLAVTNGGQAEASQVARYPNRVQRCRPKGLAHS